jgi:amino acid permease
MIERAGIPGLSHIVNAVMIIAAMSVANADLYVTVMVALTITYC